MAKNFIVLDVEGMSTARPYNIGWIVGDKHGNIIEENSIAVLPCVWENLQNCLQAKEMTHKNVQDILEDIARPNKKYEYMDVESAKKRILNSIIMNHVNEIWAYNCAFDRGSIARLFGEDFQLIERLVTFYDIIPAIVHTRLLNKDYVEFCNENKFITAKGNVMTKAEVVYKYLTNNLVFTEEHTGLDDCKIEYNILLEAIRSGKKIDRTEHRPTWRVFKQFCAVEGIGTIIPEDPVYK